MLRSLSSRLVQGYTTTTTPASSALSRRGFLSTNSPRVGTRIKREDLKNCKRIVVKVGTAVVTHSDGFVALGRLGFVVEQLSQLQKMGKEVLLVTSGAVGIGRQRLNHQILLNSSFRDHMAGRMGAPTQLNSRACAAAGQSGLMAIYDMMFGTHDVPCAQVLVTDADFNIPIIREHLRQSLDGLLAMKVVPVVNENDVISTRKTPLVDSLNRVFWDNDSLASLLARELSADLLVLLTDVDGLYDQPPVAGVETDPIHTYDPSISVQFGEKSRVGRGGMQAKIEAAMAAVDSNVKAVVIASGAKPRILHRIVNGELVGTLFTRQVQDAAGKPEFSGSELARQAKAASKALQDLTTAERSTLLTKIADALLANQATILKANADDMAESKTAGLAPSLQSRLALTPAKLATVAEGIKQIAALEEPIGKALRHTELANGLVLKQITSPIGVLLVIFESRPDVIPQVASLAIKSGNGLLLKGGSEAIRTNTELHRIITSTIAEATAGKVSGSVIGLVHSRSEVAELLRLDSLIDLVIPRGSSQLVSAIKRESRIPVLGHAEGINHLYVDESADVATAIKVAVDGKCDYPSACNTTQCLLLHERLLADGRADAILSALREKGVTLFGGPEAVKALNLSPAESFKKEYSDLQLTVEIVPSAESAIAHVNKYGSGHTDAVVCQNKSVAERFTKAVDSGCVFHNASTRFSDGFRFGLGAEVGISTMRIHARGPVAVDGLLTTKWVLDSTEPSGHAAGEFGSGKKAFTHRSLPL